MLGILLQLKVYLRAIGVSGNKERLEVCMEFPPESLRPLTVSVQNVSPAKSLQDVFAYFLPIGLTHLGTI